MNLFPISVVKDLARPGLVHVVYLSLTHSAWIDGDGNEGARNLSNQRLSVDLDQELAMCVA